MNKMRGSQYCPIMQPQLLHVLCLVKLIKTNISCVHNPYNETSECNMYSKKCKNHTVN